IERLCAEHGVAPGALALQFSLRAPLIASTIIGVSKPERVAQTLDWAAADIPDALWRAVAALPADRTDPEANRVYKPG
ncbi:MAG: aldo/keto reductase, partial [Pseudomonadota bacterium]